MSKKINLEDAKVLAIERGCREAARRLGVAKSTVYRWSQRYKWDLRSLQYFARRRKWASKYLAEIDTRRAGRSLDWPPDYMPKARESYLAFQKQLEQMRSTRLANEQRRQAILAKYEKD
jgi:transposase